MKEVKDKIPGINISEMDEEMSEEETEKEQPD